jgi:3-hydroxyisobutyrate dehydrogenase-like beta-hydroxyacid dehydrogenase
MKHTSSIGFIGLGLMGNLMAKNIHAAGFPLYVYNRSEAKTQEFKQLGVTVVSSPKELVSHCDIIITMVTAARDVEDVVFGQHGIVTAKGKTTTVIDMSTIGPSAAKHIAKKLSSHGIEFLDAPVTGGTYGAQSGELTIFVGGSKDSYEKAKPVFESMGNNLHYMGPSGSGQAIKMINNFLIASSLVALSEGMILADSMGLPRKTLADALVTTPAVSLAMARKIQNYVSGNYQLNFTIKNMHKDLSLASKERNSESNFAMLSLVESLYTKADEEGLSDNDYSQIIDAIEKHS